MQVKNSLQMLVEEIVINNEEVIIRGSYISLAAVLHQMKMGTSSVPTFIHDWCARRESNPSASETTTRRSYCWCRNDFAWHQSAPSTQPNDLKVFSCLLKNDT